MQLLTKEIGCYCSCLAEKPGYDAGKFVMEMREKVIAPHVAQITNGRRSAIDNRRCHPGSTVSQRIRKCVEEAFGWAKILTSGKGGCVNQHRSRD